MLLKLFQKNCFREFSPFLEIIFGTDNKFVVDGSERLEDGRERFSGFLFLGGVSF